jgi:CRP/FNR family transcriptional regulator
MNQHRSTPTGPALTWSHPLCRGLSPAAAKLLATGRLARWNTREVLFREGSPSPGLILLLQGRVRVIRGSAEGRRHVLHEETGGGALGEVPLCDGGPMPATAIAAEPTTAVVLSPALVTALIAADATLAERLLARLARRVRSLADRLDRLATQGVQARLAAFLLERARRSSGRVVSLGMTQGELAEELGSVREVVVRELRALVDRGALVSRGAGRYEIPDPAALVGPPAGGAGLQQKSQRRRRS